MAIPITNNDKSQSVKSYMSEMMCLKFIIKFARFLLIISNSEHDKSVEISSDVGTLWNISSHWRMLNVT